MVNFLDDSTPVNSSGWRSGVINTPTDPHRPSALGSMARSVWPSWVDRGKPVKPKKKPKIRPEVRSAVKQLSTSRREQLAALEDAKADYAAERARLQKILQSQQRAEERERQAQLALARQQRTSAYDTVAREWERHGLDGREIKQALRGLAENDYLDANRMKERVRETKTWAQRFGAVSKAREKKGLSYLDEGSIVALEDQYRAIVSRAGLPKRFYDSHKDFQSWIANDVSPAEIGDRVSLAEKAIANQDKDFTKAMQSMYGIRRKDLTAYMLDRKRGTQVLEEQVAAAEIKSEIYGTGLNITNGFAEDLVDKDVTRQEARSAFDAVGQTSKDWKRLAAISGERFSDQSMIEGELGLDPKAERKKTRLASEERGRWSGTGGSAGVFGGSTSGSY